MRYPLAFLTLLPSLALLPLALCAQQPADAPPEVMVRLNAQPPPGGIALYEKRTDARPASHWPAKRKLYVQSAPDTVWYRVLALGNSYFVRQRDLKMPPVLRSAK